MLLLGYFLLAIIIVPVELGFPATVGSLTPAEVCAQPRLTGRCRAYLPRFYFNPATSQCERFIYGGCGANQNNFQTQEACERSCGRGSVVTRGSLTPAEVCAQPQLTGRCRAYMPRFYFNPATSQCERFIYGGCGANQNNFQTQEACERSCGSGSVVTRGGCPPNNVITHCAVLPWMRMCGSDRDCWRTGEQCCPTGCSSMCVRTFG